MKMGREYMASSFVEFKPADKLHGLNEKDNITQSTCNGPLNLQHTF